MHSKQMVRTNETNVLRRVISDLALAVLQAFFDDRRVGDVWYPQREAALELVETRTLQNDGRQRLRSYTGSGIEQVASGVLSARELRY